MNAAGANDRSDAGRRWGRIRWEADRFEFDGQTFLVEESAAVGASAAGQASALRFYKRREQVESLGRFFSARPGFRPRRILEMGIWDGGSVAFWNEIFRPERHVAFDLDTRGDGAAFAAWRERQPDPTSIETIWGIDQSHRDVVLALAREKLGGAPDLVIDDAAHILECLQPAFETLFPLLPPGGIYLIEDWSWGHRAAFHGDDHPWRPYGEPTRLVLELVEAVGTSGGLVANLHVDPEWIAVERGPARVEDPRNFRLTDEILRRPPRSS